MLTRKQYRGTQIGMAIGFAILLCLWRSCEEINLTIRGETAMARVTNVERSTYRRGGQYVRLVFDDSAGNMHIKRIGVNKRVPPLKQGDEFEVIYPSGVPDKAKAVDDRSFLPLILLAGGIVAGIIWCLIAIRRVDAGKPA